MNSSDQRTLCKFRWYFDALAARAEIGSKPYERMKRTVARHYPECELDHVLFRAAPSIICRSEIELLGIAAPRFAFRALFRHGQTKGLLNCRRLAVLQRELNATIPMSWDSKLQSSTIMTHVDFESETKLLADLIDKSSPVAESILPIPERWRHFHVIARDFGDLFAEGQSIHGTPFMNVTVLGGGLCSQGACFLATLHRMDDARFVHGPPEITALLRIPSESGVLQVDGLKNLEILNYFRHPKVGLNAYLEIATLPPEPFDFTSKDRQRLLEALDAVCALRSYILSDIPVIALVDANKYCEHVLANRTNKIRVTSTNIGSANHCILLVGTTKKWSTRFLAQDATSSPWIELTANELLDCRTAVDGKQGCPAISIIPVLPSRVAMHLLSSSVEAGANRIGLLRISTILHRDRNAAACLYPGITSNLPKIHANAQLPDCLLVDLEAVRHGSAERILTHFDAEEIQFLHAISRTSLAHRRWTWIQRLTHSGESYTRSIWIWNAETSTDKVNDGLSRILDVVAISGVEAGWNVVWPAVYTQDPLPCLSLPDYARAVPESDDKTTTLAFSPSLITSFLPTTIRSAFRFWPKGAACELYGFMLKDAAFVSSFSRLPGESRKAWRQKIKNLSLHGRMELISKDPSRIRRLSQALDADATACGTFYVGIASYIPELSNPPNSPSTLLAQGALNCLCKLAITLKRLGHPIATVEFVCGSRVVGVQWHILRNNPDAMHLPIVLESRDRILDWTVDSLLAATADCAEEMRELGISLALELEPGELFVAQDLIAVGELLRIAARKRLDILALNLDIGHFRMAEHLASDALHWRESLNRLIPYFAHCHASSHSVKGHFADGPLTDKAVQDMRSWFEVYAQASRHRLRHGLPVSTFVSVELEAAGHPSLVEQSTQSLSRFCRREGA